MTKPRTGLLFWTPRILAILLILFLAMFSLDVFDGGGGIGRVLLGLLMHNLWTIALIAILIVAWRRDDAGAIGFLGFGAIVLVAGAILGMLNRPAGGGMFNIFALILLAGVPLLIGLLFLLGWKFKK